MTLALGTRSGRATAAFLFTAATLGTVAIIRRDPELALIGGSAAAGALEVAAGAALVLAAIVVWRPGAAFPLLLTAVAVAWLIAEWNSPRAGLAFTPGLLLYAAWPPLLAAAALRGVGERQLDRASGLVVGVASVAAVGVLGLASAALFDPHAQSCGQCPANLVSIGNAPGVERSLGRLGLAVTVLWVFAFVVIAAVQLVRSAPARRWLTAPVLIPSVAAVVLFGVDAAHGFDRTFLSNDSTDRTLRVAEGLALLLVAAGVGIVRLRARRTRKVLAQIVLDVGAAPAPGELRTRLAVSLGDPSLDLLYRLEAGEWVDGDGRPASLQADGPRETTLLRAGGEEVLAVVHRRGLLDDPELVRELATTTNLALQHERLHASRRARLEQLRASCARIVAASDEVRRGLERDLHDGAQQRLVALALNIRLARRQFAAHDPALDAALARAEDGVRAAVVDLRGVAHGLFPAVLAEEGLSVALDALAEQAPRLLPRSLPAGRFPAAVESAGYFATLEALRLTPSDVTVDGVAENGSLRLVIATDSQIQGETTQIWDRVSAVGGTVAADNGQLRLEMPCAS